MNLSDCFAPLLALGFLSLALAISLCINVILYIRSRAASHRDVDEHRYPQISERENLSETEMHYFNGVSHQEQQENSHNHHEEQENPIYGNITTDRNEVCYETMTMQRTKDFLKPSEPDLNYASLDLKLAKKRKKKHRHPQGHPQARSKLQEQLPDHLAPAVNTFLEVDVDIDSHLPSKDISTMVSHSSIYLNSQQIAQETEEMEREGGSRGWEGDQESEERMDEDDVNIGNVCAKLTESETTQSCSDHFTNSFNGDCG
ncbi:uncharacterized protein PAE49_018544 [Odontesthes bonariensis]|uniref:uncharacterized protein LOC142401664 n=1 Tax=Odontesthes bonariensis TaxID=219752 RepID=UPI003F5893A5